MRHCIFCGRTNVTPSKEVEDVCEECMQKAGEEIKPEPEEK